MTKTQYTQERDKIVDALQDAYYLSCWLSEDSYSGELIREEIESLLKYVNSVDLIKY